MHRYNLDGSEGFPGLLPSITTPSADPASRAGKAGVVENDSSPEKRLRKLVQIIPHSQ